MKIEYKIYTWSDIPENYCNGRTIDGLIKLKLEGWEIKGFTQSIGGQSGSVLYRTVLLERVTDDESNPS